MAKKSVKKSVTKIKVGKQTCGQCVFYVPNHDKKAIGSCFQVNGVIKENQSPACKGKYFKQKA